MKDCLSLIIGMPLAQAIEVLKRQCSVIKKVQLRYSDQVYTEHGIVAIVNSISLQLYYSCTCVYLKTLCTITCILKRYG